MLKSEALFAKGIAYAALLRMAAYSQTACLAAIFVAPLIVFAPVVAVESLLFTAILVFTGAASYWPCNLFAVGAGAAGFIGCFNGLMLRFEARSRQRAEAAAPNAKKKKKRRRSRGHRSDDDESGSLVALTAGALVAAIVGALP